MATTTPNYGWAVPTSSDLVKNGATAIETLGDSVDASVWNVGFGQAGKNKIINADFEINQRQFTSNTTNWAQFNAGGGTSTLTPQTFTLGAAPVAGYESKNFLQIVTASQSAVSDYANVSQAIESVRTFAGQTVTISFWAKAASGTPKIGIGVSQKFGSGGSPSAQVDTPAGAVTISTSWARYSATVAVPSISGKTLGTSNGDSLTTTLFVSAGSNYNTFASSIGNQNNTFSLWGVQVEAGSTATPFQTATGNKGTELELCQRYYQRYGMNASQATPISVAFLQSTTDASASMALPVTMRAAPSYGVSAAADVVVVWSAGTSATSSLSLDLSSPSGILFRITTSGLTTGQAGRFQVAAGATKFFELIAEI